MDIDVGVRVQWSVMNRTVNHAQYSAQSSTEVAAIMV